MMSAQPAAPGPGASPLETLRTARLVLRPFVSGDADFILRLLNEPSFLRFIGDKNVRTLEQAVAYLEDGPIRSYLDHGHGLLCVEALAAGAPLGMCGLLRRRPGQDPDLGYAFLPEACGQGFAREAAAAVLRSAAALRLPRILAFVHPQNARSIRLLEDLGFTLAPPIGETPDAVFEWHPSPT